MKRMKKLKLDFNAPVILGMALVSLVIVILAGIFGRPILTFFGVHRTSWLDPFQYTRLFTHVLTHANFAHFTGNFVLILAVGPLIEEKYGSKLLFMIAVTAFVTGLVNVLFFRHVLLMGSSGVVFMLILLASFVNIREGHLPVTVLLAAMFFLGNEIISGAVSRDNVSQLAHVLGGLCGGGFGFLIYGNKLKRAA